MLSPQVCINDKHVQQRLRSIQSNIKLCERRMQCKSIRSDAFSFCFRLDWACGRTCKVERKGLGPILGQRFHAATKVLVVAQEIAKAKRSELWQKLNSVLCEPAGKPLEMLQSCLNFARQELPLCGTCNYQPCAMQEGIMARIR